MNWSSLSFLTWQEYKKAEDWNKILRLECHSNFATKDGVMDSREGIGAGIVRHSRINGIIL